jgi:hypothetical protein
VDTGIEVRGRHLVLLNSDHDRGVALPLDLSDIPDPERAFMSAIPLAAVRPI